LIGLAVLFPLDPEEGTGATWLSVLHSGLLALAAVGICVGFLASVMYLLQARQLREKVPPGQGVRLLSLERLEQMNRRAILLAFPLLTAGVLIGLAQILPRLGQRELWGDVRVLGASALWLVFAILIYLHYGYHLRGRRVAQMTIVAFVLLLVALAASHTGVQGGSP
jgi:ABC-type uncharacterized transport system permease subunit